MCDATTDIWIRTYPNVGAQQQSHAWSIDDPEGEPLPAASLIGAKIVNVYQIRGRLVLSLGHAPSPGGDVARHERERCVSAILAAISTPGNPPTTTESLRRTGTTCNAPWIVRLADAIENLTK